MDSKAHIVIIGATSLIAEHCAREWVKTAAVLTLVGRHQDKLNRIAADLRVRNPLAKIQVNVADFVTPSAIQSVVDEIVLQGAVDTVLIAQGHLSDQAHCQRDLTACADALTINAISPVLFAEAFARYFEHKKRGTLALIGSVAGVRGRKSNYIYGAAKGLLARYVQGLQHRFAGTAVKVILINPGPTDTPMTAHLKQQGTRLASVEQVALQVVSAMRRGQAVVYTPWPWRYIMGIIRLLPASVFNRLPL